jgi:hypothetical protein
MALPLCRSSLVIPCLVKKQMARLFLDPPLCPGGGDEDKLQQSAASVREALRSRLTSEAKQPRLPLWGLDVLQEDPRTSRILAKFLAASNGDVKPAADHLLSARAWRDRVRADSATQAHPYEPLHRSLSLLDAVDEAGQPVLLFRLHPLLQPDGWHAAFASPDNGTDALLLEFVRVIETAIERRLSFIAGKGPTAFTVVHDLRNCSTSSILASSNACKVLSNAVSQLTLAYPEMTARHVSLGAPYYAFALMSTALGSLPAQLRSKIVHAGASEELHLLTRFIRIEHLPVELGGFCSIMPSEAKVGRKTVESSPKEVARLRSRDSGTLRCCVAMLRGSANVGLFVVEDSEAKERVPTAQGHAVAGGDPCYVDTDVRYGSTIALYISSQSYFYSADASFALGRAPPMENGKE